jgi:2-hydroxycyclohexanecarboxyl-CoA dehydrogenase
LTGAASNIGRGIALSFAEERAAVAIADIDEERAQAVAAEALLRGASKSMAVKADVSNWAEGDAMTAQVENAFGTIDILVNNAAWVVDRLFVEKLRTEWEKEVQIYLWGMINCSRAVLDGMISRSRGAVVSIASDR